MLGYATIDSRRTTSQMKNMKASMPVHDRRAVRSALPVWGTPARTRALETARIAGYCGDGETLDPR
jgi:hypothetical protein